MMIRHDNTSTSLFLLQLGQFLADGLNDPASVLQLHLEVHDLVDVLELSLVCQVALGQECLHLSLVLFSVLSLHLHTQ